MILTKLSDNKSHIEYTIPVYFSHNPNLGKYIEIKGSLRYYKNKDGDNCIQRTSLIRNMELLVFKHKIGKQSRINHNGVSGLSSEFIDVTINGERFPIIEKIIITDNNIVRKLRDFKLSKLGIL